MKDLDREANNKSSNAKDPKPRPSSSREPSQEGPTQAARTGKVWPGEPGGSGGHYLVLGSASKAKCSPRPCTGQADVWSEQIGDLHRASCLKLGPAVLVRLYSIMCFFGLGPGDDHCYPGQPKFVANFHGFEI